MRLFRFVKYLVLLALALGIVTLSLANREPVTLQLLPEDLAAFVGYNQTVEQPIFVIILLAVAAGLLIGFIWEWLRETRHRSEASRARAEARRLEEKLARQSGPARPKSDDVLALVDSKVARQPAR